MFVKLPKVNGGCKNNPVLFYWSFVYQSSKIGPIGGLKSALKKKVSKGQNRYRPNLLGTCRLIFTWELLWGTKDHFLTFIRHISVKLIFCALFTYQKYLASFSPIISPTSQLKSQVKKIKIYIFVMHFKF